MDTEFQISTLKMAMKNRHFYEQYQAVKLVLEGHTKKEASQIIGEISTLFVVT